MDKLNKLYIEPTSKCNLSCIMCFRNTWFDESFSDMDIKTFNRIMETMPDSVETVFFGGMGEPLYHKDIVYMVKSAADKNKKVELLTNGTMLSREMTCNLLDAGLSMLWVSIDSFETEEYEKIRQNSKLSLVFSNIQKYNSERTRRECEAKLGIAFVAMKSNVRQMGQLGRFASKNNVSEINISNIIPTDKESLDECLYDRVVSLELGSKNLISTYPQINLPFMDSRLADVRAGLMSLLETDCVYKVNGEPLIRRKNYCKFIEEGNAFVRHDGDVSPCMALLHSGVTFLEGNERMVYHHSFGNTHSQGLDEIWNSKEYVDFRSRVRNFEFSPCIQCGGCENRDDNRQDCLGNHQPTCGACLWSEGIISCP